jgi:hypothetical protein
LEHLGIGSVEGTMESLGVLRPLYKTVIGRTLPIKTVLQLGCHGVRVLGVDSEDAGVARRPDMDYSSDSSEGENFIYAPLKIKQEAKENEKTEKKQKHKNTQKNSQKPQRTTLRKLRKNKNTRKHRKNSQKPQNTASSLKGKGPLGVYSRNGQRGLTSRRLTTLKT